MSKRVYISADYSDDNGDKDVVEVLKQWGSDALHKVEYIDMAEVKSGSVSNDSDCRPCDLKEEFNKQINASSAVIFVVGDKTAIRTAGSNCNRASHEQNVCKCTPYKQNSNGTKACKVIYTTIPEPTGDVGNINSYSYLRHEFEQAKKKQRTIIIVYNSLRKQPSWLPSYMEGYESLAEPFWIKDSAGNTIGNYNYIKEALGYA